MSGFGLRMFMAGASAVGLMACSNGGTSSGDIPADDALVRIEEFAAMTERLEDRFNSEFTEIPTSGSATYEGFAGIDVGTGAEQIALLGDASMDLDFTNDRMSGEITNVIGQQGGDFGNYSGQIDLENGALRSGRPNRITFDYGGRLNGQGNVIELDGTGEGVFKGTPIRGILAQSDSGDTANLNGTDTPVEMNISVER